MSYNGNGVFLINTPGQPVVSGTTITSTAFNALTTDLASGLTNAITKDGQTNITANIPMSNFKITGLGAATSSNDAVRLAQIQDGIINGRFVNLEYTGTFTGGTGVVNLGSGQVYKDASGNVGIGTTSPLGSLDARGNVYLGSTSAGSTTFVRGAQNWNFSGLNVIRNAANTGSPRLIAMPLDGDDLASTTIGAYNAIWGAYDSSPTTSSTSSALNGAMVYGAYAGHRWVNNGSEKMRVEAGGNVGIGTISPQAKLAVSNAGVAGFEFITNYPGGGVGTYVQSYNRSTSAYIDTAYYANSHKFWANGDAMFIDSSGNVGIGTTTLLSGSKFDVNGRGRFFQDAAATTGAVIIRQDITNTVGGYLQWVNNDNTAQTGYLGVLPNSTFVFGAAASERMRISSVGEVGIGTVSPAYTLDVQATTGTVSVTSTTGTNFSKVQVNNTGGTFQLGIDNSNGSNYGSSVAYARCVWNDSATAPTLFYTNSAERMRIDASGNVSIKVTSAIGRFNVQSDDAATAITAGNVSGTAAYNGALFYNNGFTSLVGQISISGATASYLSVSDYRLKESVAPMTGALAKVAQLKPVTYKWKSDGSDGQGFIAHELQAVVPDCVTGDKDAVDAEGKPKYQGVDTSFLVATLTAAIQEQQAIISAMETRLAALEA